VAIPYINRIAELSLWRPRRQAATKRPLLEDQKLMKVTSSIRVKVISHSHLTSFTLLLSLLHSAGSTKNILIGPSTETSVNILCHWTGARNASFHFCHFLVDLWPRLLWTMSVCLLKSDHSKAATVRGYVTHIGSDQLDDITVMSSANVQSGSTQCTATKERHPQCDSMLNIPATCVNVWLMERHFCRRHYDWSTLRTAKFITQCKVVPLKQQNHKVWPHDVQMSRRALTRRAALLSICNMVLFTSCILATLLWMTLSLSVTYNWVIVLVARLNGGTFSTNSLLSADLTTYSKFNFPACQG